MPDDELAAIGRLMRFCSEQGLDDPDAADIRAHAALDGLDHDGMVVLERGLAILGASASLTDTIRIEAGKLCHRAEFAAISFASRPRTRRVSVAPEELPQLWQDGLRSLRDERAFAPSILDRMQQRLCLFAWSARRAGKPVDLASVPALKACYADLRSRSMERNGGRPRFAYLRSTWEEFDRFAAAIGLPDAARQVISNTLNMLRRCEDGQSARKFAKLAGAPDASNLIRLAGEMLDEAGTLQQPHHRHAARNAAAAIALGIAVPARPGDVHAHHILGRGVFFDPGRAAWRFDYLPGKTRSSIPEPLELRLDPFWNRFIDALILQDHDHRWLGELRHMAITRQRPLYINYDGSACSPRWYSRIWAEHVGTGGHIARSLIYDEMADLGEFGLQYARLANHHRSDTIPKKYRGQAAVKKSIHRGQDAMVGRGGEGEDITNLL